MGGGAHTTSNLCHRWVFNDEVSMTYAGVCFCVHVWCDCSQKMSHPLQLVATVDFHPCPTCIRPLRVSVQEGEAEATYPHFPACATSRSARVCERISGRRGHVLKTRPHWEESRREGRTSRGLVLVREHARESRREQRGAECNP